MSESALHEVRRARELAMKARRLADGLSRHDRELLLKHAEELEAKARELEQAAASVRPKDPESKG